MNESRFEVKEIGIMEFIGRFMAHIPTKVSVDEGKEKYAYGTYPLPFDYDIDNEETAVTTERRNECMRWIAKQFPEIHTVIESTLLSGTATEKRKTLANLAKRMRFTVKQYKAETA